MATAEGPSMDTEGSTTGDRGTVGSDGQPTPAARVADDGGTALRIDCHVHTSASFDSSARVEHVLQSAAASGLDGLVVTDHDHIANARVAVERGPAFDLVVIPGVEVSTTDGHVLGIGVDERPPTGDGFEETVAAIRAAGGLAVVPHPFQRTRHGVPASVITDCDGIEVFNAHTLTGLRNRQAHRFATRRGLARFAGSDAHRAANVGRAHTVVGVPTRSPTPQDVVTAMATGPTWGVGRRTPTRGVVRKLAENAKRNSARLLPV